MIEGVSRSLIQKINFQIEKNDMAENQYYLALCHKKLAQSDLFLQHMTKAKELYLNNRKMVIIYTEPIDRVYLEEINLALNGLMDNK